MLCHGYALNLDSWHFQRRDLRDVARLVLWDQRSHGRSGRSTVPHATLEQTGRDLGDVIDEVAPDGPLVLVGHSMGGMTIMSLAEQRPELFRDRVVGVGAARHVRGRADRPADGAARAARPAGRPRAPRRRVGARPAGRRRRARARSSAATSGSR